MFSVYQELRKAGLRATFPRVRVLQVLIDSPERHMSAEDIFKAMLGSGSEVGLATIYRVLTQLENAGLLESHNFNNGHKVYELNRGDDHDHMVCIDSGRVIEFRSPKIEELQQEIAEKHGYEVAERSLVLYVKPK